MARINQQELEKDNFFIYLYRWEDGCIYIGKCSNSNKRHRYGQIYAYKNSPLVYRKMNKYSDFTKEILEDNILSLEKANLKENYYIEKYNSYHYKNPLGLNLTLGGEGTLGVIPWNKNKHYTTKPCKEETKKKISNATKGRIHSQEHLDEIHLNICKPVLQYDKNGNFIREYTSAVEASRFLNKKTWSEICRCANKTVKNGYLVKSAYGYIWRWKYE